MHILLIITNYSLYEWISISRSRDKKVYWVITELVWYRVLNSRKVQSKEQMKNGPDAVWNSTQRVWEKKYLKLQK